jgi:uncharacterized protein (TIGR00369 family)
MDATLQPLPGSPGCIVCDNNGSNPRSLKLRLLWDETTGRVHIPCQPDESWCGYSNIVHGGVIASVLDEAMAWAVKQNTGDWAFTAECLLRFKRPVSPGGTYMAIAGVDEIHKRKITAHAYFLAPDGKVAVEVSATFLPAKGRALPRQAGE